MNDEVRQQRTTSYVVVDVEGIAAGFAANNWVFAVRVRNGEISKVDCEQLDKKKLVSIWCDWNKHFN